MSGGVEGEARQEVAGLRGRGQLEDSRHNAGGGGGRKTDLAASALDGALGVTHAREAVGTCEERLIGTEDARRHGYQLLPVPCAKQGRGALVAPAQPRSVAPASQYPWRTARMASGCREIAWGIRSMLYHAGVGKSSVRRRVCRVHLDTMRGERGDQRVDST